MLSLVCPTVQVWWMTNAKSVAHHSRHMVRILQSFVIHTLISLSFWAPSDLHVLLNEDNDGQIRWTCPVQTLVDNGTQLVCYLLTDMQPVYVVTKCRCNVFILPLPHDECLFVCLLILVMYIIRPVIASTRCCCQSPVFDCRACRLSALIQ